MNPAGVRELVNGVGMLAVAIVLGCVAVGGLGVALVALGRSALSLDNAVAVCA